MVFFRRYKHKLPRFPHTVIPTFRNLCEVLPDEDVEKLLPQLDTHLLELEETAKSNPNVNIVLGRELSERSRYLLTHYPEFGKKEKSLILGAIRYFAHAQDPVSETTFASGFDDDVQVMNYVLERLGLENLYIRIR